MANDKLPIPQLPIAGPVAPEVSEQAPLEQLPETTMPVEAIYQGAFEPTESNPDNIPMQQSAVGMDSPPTEVIAPVVEELEAPEEIYEDPTQMSIPGEGQSIVPSVATDVFNLNAPYENDDNEVSMYDPKNGYYVWEPKESVQTAIQEGLIIESVEEKMTRDEEVNPYINSNRLVFADPITGELELVERNEKTLALDSGLKPVTEDAYAQIKFEEYKDSLATPASALTMGFLRGTSLGFSDGLYYRDVVDKIERKYPILVGVGEVASYINPFGIVSGAGRGAIKLTAGTGAKITNKYLTKAFVKRAASATVRGTAEGAAIGTTNVVSKAIAEDKAPTVTEAALSIGKDTVALSLFGGGLSLAGSGVWAVGKGGVLLAKAGAGAFGLTGESITKAMSKLPIKQAAKAAEIHASNRALKSGIQGFEKLMDNLPSSVKQEMTDQLKYIRKVEEKLGVFRGTKELGETGIGKHTETLVEAKRAFDTRLEGYFGTDELLKIRALMGVPKVQDANKAKYIADIYEMANSSGRKLDEIHQSLYKSMGLGYKATLIGSGIFGYSLLTGHDLETSLVRSIGIPIGGYTAMKYVVPFLHKRFVSNKIGKGLDAKMYLDPKDGALRKAVSKLSKKDAIKKTMEYVNHVSDRVSEFYSKGIPARAAVIRVLNEDEHEQWRDSLRDIELERVKANSFNGLIEHLPPNVAKEISGYETTKISYLKMYSEKDKIKFSKALAAVDLRGSLARINNGDHTKQDIEFLRVGYPKLYSEIDEMFSELEYKDLDKKGKRLYDSFHPEVAGRRQRALMDVYSKSRSQEQQVKRGKLKINTTDVGSNEAGKNI